jgi:hypothetical protein
VNYRARYFILMSVPEGPGGGGLEKTALFNYNLLRIIIYTEIEMFDIIKTKLWDILKEKDVSLAMLYDREGRILWHKGREIAGKTIQEGEGFSKSYLFKSLQTGEGIDRENVVIASSKDTLPKSAYSLLLKGILIQPIEKDLFLYIDSGTKESFNDNERHMFRMLGDMLAETVSRMRDTRGKPGGVSGSSGALEYYDKSIKIMEELGDKKFISYAYINIGLFYQKTGNYPKALESFFKSLKITEELKNNSDMKEDKKISILAQDIILDKENQWKLREREYVKISVQDNGKGIPEDLLGKIIDPYFSTKERGVQKGMGMGLAVCYAIVRRHGGHLAVTSSLQKGTTVDFYIPVYKG